MNEIVYKLGPWIDRDYNYVPESQHVIVAICAWLPVRRRDSTSTEDPLLYILTSTITHTWTNANQVNSYSTLTPIATLSSLDTFIPTHQTTIFSPHLAHLHYFTHSHKFLTIFLPHLAYALTLSHTLANFSRSHVHGRSFRLPTSQTGSACIRDN